MGVYPKSFLDPIHADIRALDARVARAAPAGDAQLRAAGKAPPAVIDAEAHR
jgi:NADH-quinone oxidoreductase subunit M